MREALAKEKLNWVLQAEQLGTGHAVQQAMPGVPDDHLVLVLFGDVPLVQPATMQRLVEAAAGGDALGVLSVRMRDPTGYGRIVRDRAGKVARIVEHKDANAKERAVDEVNTGLMAGSARRIREWLGQLRNDNAQGEYYLTDIVVMAAQGRAQGQCDPGRTRGRSARRQRQGAARRGRSRVPRADAPRN